MIYINQNLFSLDRQNAREYCNLIILFRQRGSVVYPLYKDFFNETELSNNEFVNICTKVWKQRYSYLVLDESKHGDIHGRLKINWDKRVL